MTTTTDNFTALSGLGFGPRLLPVIPPDAPLNPNSSLAKRKDARGKAVGVKGRDGQWHGLDWINYTADEDDHRRWSSMGAGTGIKTGDGLVAIDADTLDEQHAGTIRDIIRSFIDTCPIRVGKYPKALYLVRVSEPYRYTRVEFGERNDKGTLTDRVEILSDGRQFVAYGIHPNTGKPYHWPKEPVHFDHLPIVSAGTLDELMRALRQALPAASDPIKEGSTTEVAQHSLRGELAHIRAAVSAIPNTSAHFPTREAYRDFGYAIKAALPDNTQEAFDIFADWCARWEDGDNDPGIVEADWRRMKPPFRRGAGWLYEMAERINPKAFSAASIWFDEIDHENPFEQIHPVASQTDTYSLLTIAELMRRPPPIWLIDRHIPQQSVGFIYSAPGAGKTFIALDMSLHITTGRDKWYSDPINADDNPVVIYIASEGSFDIRNRVMAWLHQHKQDPPSGFLLIEQTINFMSVEDVNKLLRTIATVRPARPVLVVVDTVSRALPGADENLQKDMTIFVKACDAVRDAFACAVIGVHHAGKSGDMRGSTVLRGAGDFVFSLERKKGATIGTFACEKMKAAPDGWEEPYRFDLVTLADGQSSLVPCRAEVGVGPSVDMTPALSSVVLSAMSRAWEEGAPWCKAPQSKERYAVRRMVADHGFTAVSASDILSIWVATGLITHELRSAKDRIYGYKVAGGLGQAVHNDGIFG